MPFAGSVPFPEHPSALPAWSTARVEAAGERPAFVCRSDVY